MNAKKGLSEINLNSTFRELNPITQHYIQDVIKVLNHHIGIDALTSLILFGSQIRTSHTKVSDCDLLIIIKEETPESLITILREHLLTLEIKYQFLEYNNKNLLSSILFAIQRTTGMFVSHFITRKTNFMQGQFYKIFSVNRIFSKLLAPKKLVLLNVIDNSAIIYGEDLRREVQAQLAESSFNFDVIKSLMMNLTISLFSFVLIPFRKLDPVKYVLEAVKWSVKSIHYFLFHDSEQLEKVLIRLIYHNSSPRKRTKIRQFVKRFLHLRKNPRLDIGFMIQAPLRIISMHIHAF